MKVQKRKSSVERKKEIVQTAIRLAGDVGPDRLTTQHLADAIGISQPAIFRHFATKEAIWQAVAEQIASSMKANAALAVNEHMTPLERLRGLLMGHLEFMQSTPAVPAILFSSELHAENAGLRDYFSGLTAGRHRAFSGMITAQINAGNFRPDLDPDDAAYLILALVQGLAMRWSLNGRGFDLVEEGSRLFELQLIAFVAVDAV